MTKQELNLFEEIWNAVPFESVNHGDERHFVLKLKPSTVAKIRDIVRPKKERP
jgi:hypothetical protein